MSETVLCMVCAWCRRRRVHHGEWREAESTDTDGPTTTHGICPDCLERATARATIPAGVSG